MSYESHDRRIMNAGLFEQRICCSEIRAADFFFFFFSYLPIDAGN